MIAAAGRLPRVCLLTETYHPVVGGGEKQAQALAHELAAAGLPVLVIARRSSAELARTEAVDGTPVHRIRPLRAGRFTRWLMVASALVALARLRRQYDVILVSGFKALGISAVVACRLVGKRSVLKADSNGEMSGAFFASGLQTIGLSPESAPVRLFLRLRNAILRRADAFVAITSDIEDEFRKAGLRPERLHRISNGVDTARFATVSDECRLALRRRLGLPDKRVLVIYTGRLVTYKGLPLLLEVARDIRHEHGDVGFVLVGSGGLDLHNCESALRSYVSRHGLEDCVHFAGEVTNVEHFLQACDVFALPSRDDAFPLALVEAMSCGLPCVTTRVGGMREIVTHGSTGVLVPPDDRGTLHAALRELISSQELRAAIGQAAASTVRARYGMPVVARQYIRLFEELPGSTAAARVGRVSERPST